nr:ABC transporter ATP-binding protein [uncultured Desulfobacter sp.]
MLKLILKYLKGSARISACTAPLLMLLEVLMDLQQPALMARIIDTGVANGDLHYVLATGLVMILVAVIGLLGGAGCSVFASIASVSMSAKMRHGLFCQIQSLSFSEINRFQTSSLITRLTNDVMQMQQLVAMMLRGMVRAPLLCGGGIVMSYLLSPKLSLVFLVMMPVIFFSTVIIMKKSVPLFSRVQEKLDGLNTVMRETLLGIRVIKSFSMEKRQYDRFAAVNELLTKKSIKAQNMTFLLMPIMILVMNLSVVAVLWFGGNMAMGQSLEIGKLMAFVNYLVQITLSFTMFVNIMINLSRTQASSKRISEVFAAAATVRDPDQPAAIRGWDIEFEHVGFRYSAGADDVLKDISFRIRQGETVGIIGGTGSGKSTLVGLIPRLFDPTKGRVLMGGKDIRDLSLSQVRHITGMVTQESILFSGTVKDNLHFGCNEAIPETMAAACADAQALEFINALPKSFDSPVEQRAKNFSGGQKQRLSIARALIKNPGILILDDAASALDLKTEAHLRRALSRRSGERTLIIVAQRVAAIRDADKIIVLENGSITAMGTHKQLMASSDIYQSIALSQLGEKAVSNVHN